MPRIKAAAETNGRSMNSEIVSRLEASFNSDVQDVEQIKHERDAALARERKLVETMVLMRQRTTMHEEEIRRLQDENGFLRDLAKDLKEGREPSPEGLEVYPSAAEILRELQTVKRVVFDLAALRAASSMNDTEPPETYDDINDSRHSADIPAEDERPDDEEDDDRP